MVAQRSDTVADLIAEAVAKEMPSLPSCLRYWVQAHLVTPRPILLSRDSEGHSTASYWLVTDHVGIDDAPCRVVFDGDAFGLAMTLENGTECFMGRAASFADAVQNM
jgi:hypothetical protein